MIVYITVVRARRLLILCHRYLGIGLSPLLVMWFLTGITMIFAGGMPEVDPGDRLQRLSPIDFDRVRLSPSAAASKARLSDTPSRVTLLTIIDRPAYRFESRDADDDDTTIVFADTGELLNVGADESLRIAARYIRQPLSDLEYRGLLRDPDQWTLTVRHQLPLHKIAVDDRGRTVLYISPLTANVVMVTTARTRALAWISAIPHWLYFTALRSRNAWWR